MRIKFRVGETVLVPVKIVRLPKINSAEAKTSMSVYEVRDENGVAGWLTEQQLAGAYVDLGSIKMTDLVRRMVSAVIGSAEV